MKEIVRQCSFCGKGSVCYRTWRVHRVNGDFTVVTVDRGVIINARIRLYACEDCWSEMRKVGGLIK